MFQQLKMRKYLFSCKLHIDIRLFNNSVEGIEAENGPKTVYDLNGRTVTGSPENLMPGIYIIKEGKTTKKVAVK